MATGIVLTVAEKLYAALHSQELRDVCSMFGYESQLDDLKVTVSTIKCVLLDAESKHQELTHEGREYIERLKEAVYNVDDLLDEFNTMVHKNKLIKGSKRSKKVRRFFSRSNQFLVAYNMSNEIKSLRGKLDKIAKDRQQFGFSYVYVPIKRKPDTMSFVGEDSIIGREDDREAIVKMLLGDSVSESSNVVGHKVSYVSIVAIGGLGKTALAQLVYNDSRVEKAFELRLWVCVSDDFVLEKIFRQMLGRDVFNIEDLQRQVRNLIEGKRYLLVLDDVWSESRDEWDKLKSFLDLGGRGSRVVVTSRSKKVAKVVGDDLMYELKGLSEESSWNLFKRLAFEQGKEPMNSTDHLYDIGKEIVKKCANVPLAIRVVASMLYARDDRKWISFKNANLMYSYYHLTPALKSCFSYCALFPKDIIIEKEILVRLWLAQGCLDQNEEDVELLRAAHLKDLVIQFSDQGAIDESLLACLKPPSKLTGIKIKSYKGLKLPSWAESLASSLPNLVTIKLRNFDGIEILPSLSRLRHLKCLALWGMPNVEFMESEVVVGPAYDELLFYPSLEQLTLCKFPKLKGWWSKEKNWETGKVGSSSAVVPTFPSLRELFLEKCPSLKSLPSCSKLCTLDLQKCHGSLTFLGPSSSLSSGIPLLYVESVTTDNIGAIECLFEKYPEGIHNLRIEKFEGENLSTLAEKCREHAPCIKQLAIWGCPNLMSLSGVVKHITSLQGLTIESCQNLESLQLALSLGVAFSPKVDKSAKGASVLDLPSILIDRRLWKLGSTAGMDQLPHILGKTGNPELRETEIVARSNCAHACSGES